MNKHKGDKMNQQILIELSPFFGAAVLWIGIGIYALAPKLRKWF